MMKKIIKLKEEDVLDGMTEDIKRIIKKTFNVAFFGISILFAVLVLSSFSSSICIFFE